MIDECRLRVLRGTLETPTMREDGTVLETPGYDQQSGLLLETGGVAFLPIPQQPTKQDAETALKIIDEVIKEFPFDGHPNGLIKCPSRSVAISMFLSALIGRTMPAVPMHLFDAPAAGTGKSLLVDCAAIIGTGKVAAKMAQGRDEAEDEKRLAGAVLQGDAMLCVDNVEQPLGGDFLCSLITEPVVQVRPLGQTGNVEVPANLVLCATGNNIKVRGDMTRRAIKCRLDANREHPEERPFKGDLRDYARENRAELVTAGLTIMRAFAVALDRQQVLEELTPYGSFEKWSDRVRGALVWLGEVDPCTSREAIRDDDPVTAKLATLVAAWVECPPLGVSKIEAGGDDGWYLLDQVFAAANKADRQDGGYVYPQLRAALEAIMPRGITPDGLGRFLTRYADRIVGGYRLRKRQHPVSKRAQYLVETAPQDQRPARTRGPAQAEAEFDFTRDERAV